MAVQLEILPLFWALCLHLLLTLPWPYIVSNFILFYYYHKNKKNKNQHNTSLELIQCAAVNCNYTILC